jgi:hypothetical protein
MKLACATVAVGLFFCGSAAAHNKPDAAAQVPLPPPAARPDATELACQPALSTEVGSEARKSGKAGGRASIRGGIFKATALEQHLKLKLEADRIGVAFGAPALKSGEIVFGSFFAFRIVSDRPTGILAMDERAASGQWQTIALNRNTGTLILTTAGQGLTEHPYSHSTFYACRAPR